MSSVRHTSPTFAEKIVTGLAASVVAAGLIIGSIVSERIDSNPRFNVGATVMRPRSIVRSARIRYLPREVTKLGSVFVKQANFVQ